MNAKDMIKVWSRNTRRRIEDMIDDGEIDHATTIGVLLDILIRKEQTGE